MINDVLDVSNSACLAPKAKIEREPPDPQQQGIAELPEARRFRGANFRARPEVQDVPKRSKKCMVQQQDSSGRFCPNALNILKFAHLVSVGKCSLHHPKVWKRETVVMTDMEKPCQIM